MGYLMWHVTVQNLTDMLTKLHAKDPATSGLTVGDITPHCKLQKWCGWNDHIAAVPKVTALPAAAKAAFKQYFIDLISETAYTYYKHTADDNVSSSAIKAIF